MYLSNLTDSEFVNYVSTQERLTEIESEFLRRLLFHDTVNTIYELEDEIRDLYEQINDLEEMLASSARFDE